MPPAHAIGQPAPELEVSDWVQGGPVTLADLKGSVVLVEVFQVNCPGCFVHALPIVSDLHTDYHRKGLVVLGLATAFEDFDKNTLENLEKLVRSGELTGEPLAQLGAAGLLNDNRIDFELPYPIAMDALDEAPAAPTQDAIEAFIIGQLPDYPHWPDARRQPVYEKAKGYLQARTHVPRTFEKYGLQGTPSSILIDREGRLREVAFGRADHLEPLIRDLL